MEVFRQHDSASAPAADGKHFGSDKVLAVLRKDLQGLGFQVEERGKNRGSIERPVFFGENGEPSLRYRVDAYHETWRCGLEVEAGRGLMGNAVYRDLVQAMMMTGIDHLIVGVLNYYRGGKGSRDYAKAIAIAAALYGHDRIKMPFGLTLVGYGPDDAT